MSTAQYEVESRAIVPEERFEQIKTHFAGIALSQRELRMKTFLFNEDAIFARIRLKSDKKGATFTIKEGSHSDKGRKETNKQITLDGVPAIVTQLKEKGATKCSYLHSQRWSFELPSNIHIDLSKHEFLGNILEAEIMVDHQEEVDKAYAQTLEILASVGLQVLSGEEYKKMMDKLFADTLKPADSYLSEMMIPTA
jgi:adenylate cyclase class IV